MFCHVKVINKNVVAQAILNKNIKTFVLHISNLTAKIKIHLSKEA